MSSLRSTYVHLIVGVALLASGCSPIVNARGHNDESEGLKQIIVGQSRQEDVAAALGSPSAKSTYGEETWYYISMKKETRGMYAPEITDQKVTSITFDTDGTVKDIDETGKDKARQVTFVEKKTPTEGREMNAIEQMLGNFGRFNAPGQEIDPRNLGR